MVNSIELIHEQIGTDYRPGPNKKLLKGAILSLKIKKSHWKLRDKAQPRPPLCHRAILHDDHHSRVEDRPLQPIIRIHRRDAVLQKKGRAQPPLNNRHQLFPRQQRQALRQEHHRLPGLPQRRRNYHHAALLR